MMHHSLKHKIAIAILWGILLISFAACNQRSIYQQYHSVNANGWHADSVVSFNFEIKDTTETYQILFNNRNLDSYPFSNIWLFVEIMAPDSSLVYDTIEYQLSHPNGKWIGNGTSGVYDTRLIYRDNVYFPLSGEYEIDVKHGMRNKKLKGISDFGLSIEKIDKQ